MEFSWFDFNRAWKWARANPLTLFLQVLLFVGLARAAFYLLIGLNNTLIDIYSFRQAQTAITAYWMLQDGFALAYQTPVLGFPWEIPFELPVYQSFMAFLSWFGVPLDAAGRLVTFLFFVLCLLPIRILLNELGMRRQVFLFISILFVFSPLYVFWSRTVMIESVALFFGLGWAAWLAQYLRTGRWSYFVLATVSGVLGILTKSTTFAMFGLLGVALTAVYFAGGMDVTFRRFHLRPDTNRIARSLKAVAACALVFVLGIAWVAYTDSVKELNPLGTRLTSYNLTRFNFGSVELRVSAELWRDAMLNRALPDMLGPLFLGAIGVVGAALMSKRYAILAVAAVVAFLVPVLVFTNLHKVHSYYQYANALFLLAAVGFGVAALVEGGRQWLGIIVFLVIVSSQVLYFHNSYPFHFDGYAALIRQDHTANSRYKAGMAAREVTSPDQSILVFGDDWSSAIPYYARRKALVLPGWAQLELVESLLDAPQEYLGDKPLGAIVSCGVDQYGGKGPLIQAFLERREVVADIGPCQIYTVDSAPRKTGHEFYGISRSVVRREVPDEAQEIQRRADHQDSRL